MTTPTRVEARPSPAEWDLDELMSLPEAAALFWPEGPLSVSSLRVAVRDGVLPVTIVAGKILTTRRAVLAMSVCHPAPGREVSADTDADREDPTDDAFAAAVTKACARRPEKQNPRRHR